MGELLPTKAACDREIIELQKMLRLVSKTSKPLVWSRIDEVLDRRNQLDKRLTGGSAASRRTLPLTG